jgi:hypothetical protein
MNENPSGWDSHTYLYHIINNFDNLAEWTTFCQGHPFDHCKDFLRKWNTEPKLGFDFVANRILQCDGYGKPHHLPNKIPVGKCYEAIFDNPTPPNFIFGAGAQWLAHRDVIRSNHKEAYKYIMDLGNRPPFDVDYTYVLERLWIYILGIDPANFQPIL